MLSLFKFLWPAFRCIAMFNLHSKFVKVVLLLSLFKRWGNKIFKSLKIYPMLYGQKMTELGFKSSFIRLQNSQLQITEFYCSFHSIFLCNKYITTLDLLKWGKKSREICSTFKVKNLVPRKSRQF